MVDWPKYYKHRYGIKLILDENGNVYTISKDSDQEYMGRHNFETDPREEICRIVESSFFFSGLDSFPGEWVQISKVEFEERE